MQKLDELSSKDLIMMATINLLMNIEGILSGSRLIDDLPGVTG